MQISCRHHYSLLWGPFSHTAFPNTPARGEVLWGACKTNWTYGTGHAYIHEGVKGIWSVFSLTSQLLLRGGIWQQTRWFPHATHWPANGSLLWFCTPAIMCLDLKHDPDHCMSSLWGVLSGLCLLSPWRCCQSSSCCSVDRVAWVPSVGCGDGVGGILKLGWPAAWTAQFLPADTSH